MAKIYASKSDQISEREMRNMQRVRSLAPQGMVLLQNNGALPLRTVGKLALFGSGARRTVKGGSGSGDVNSRTVISVEQGLENAGFTVETKAWLDHYDRLCDEKMASQMQYVAQLLAEKGSAGITEIISTPYYDPDVPEIDEEDLKGLDADTAVYVLGRTSGEGADRKLRPGDYYLSDHERQNLTVLSKLFSKLIVVLNVGGVIDTKPLRANQDIDAILLMGQAGNISGDALADILTGKVTPSGHLAATWAENYTDYPNAAQFSYMNGNVDDEYYNEGIYVGYRYFDSTNTTPAYPFGYGLSYTTFQHRCTGITIEGETVTVSAAVTNTGTAFSGKEVLQLYASAPAGMLDKPFQSLVGFGKTKELAPGEETTISISFPVSFLASYDEKQAAYILESGKYWLRLGTHSRNTHIIAALEQKEDAIVQQLSNKILLDEEMVTHAFSNFWSPSADAEEKEAAPIYPMPHILPHNKDVVATPAVRETNRTIMLSDVKNGTYTLEELVHQLTDAELTSLCVGTARGGFGSTSVIGAASTACPGAAGDTTSDLIESRGIPNIVLADGPAGLRLSKSFVADRDGNPIPGLGESALGGLELLFGIPKPERPADAVDYYQFCTAIPVATLLAQTWDTDLLREAGDIVGQEMLEFGVTLWLAPGMNIQRNPLCGRNFEYYSEDPVLSGRCAAGITLGVQQHPSCGTAIKHFAMNNQEDNRSHTNAHCCERAIREVYLKGFEIAIQESNPLSVMSSYNLLNGVHTANLRELLTDILRNEWGYEGLVMTDWGTTGGGDLNSTQDSYKYGFSSPVGCIQAGNDLIMPGSQADFDAIVAAVQDGSLARQDLELSAKRILSVILEKLQ